MEKRLAEELRAYAAESKLRLHMPGHKGLSIPLSDAVAKRGGAPEMLELPYALDVTELERSDDLHAPCGVLKHLIERYRRYYGARAAWLLTNGSTSGNLIMMQALAAHPFFAVSERAGEDDTREEAAEILVSRASHRSVFHALQLSRVPYRCLAARFYGAGTDLVLPPRLEEIRRAWRPSTRALLLTLPTYEGFYLEQQELCAVADFVHAQGGLFLLDAAHGAHAKTDPSFSFDPVAAGVDLAVMSLHKSLPSPTSTALLLCGSARFEVEDLRSFFDVFESSSPNYWLLLGAEACIDYLERGDFPGYETAEKLRAFLAGRGYPLLPGSDEYGRDPLKIFIPTGEAAEIQKRWRDRGVEVEYADRRGLLLMVGLPQKADLSLWEQLFPPPGKDRRPAGAETCPAFRWSEGSFRRPQSRLREKKRAADACGRALAQDLYFYPPGIPYRLRGECWLPEDQAALPFLAEAGLHGLEWRDGEAWLWCEAESAEEEAAIRERARRRGEWGEEGERRS